MREQSLHQYEFLRVEHLGENSVKLYQIKLGALRGGWF